MKKAKSNYQCKKYKSYSRTRLKGTKFLGKLVNCVYSLLAVIVVIVALGYYASEVNASIPDTDNIPEVLIENPNWVDIPFNE